MKETYSRKQLYDLVWSQPMSTLAKRFDLTDSGLRKICVRMGIPLPRAGHWQKLKSGKSVTIRSLPTAYSGEEQVHLTLRPVGAEVTSASTTEVLHHQAEVVEELQETLVVPEKLTKPDPLIRAAKNSLYLKRYHPQHEGVLTTDDGQLDIRVSPKLVPRALRFMNTLVKALKQRGHSIEFRYENTEFVIDTIHFHVICREKLKKVQLTEPWTRTVYQPIGILSFMTKGYNGLEWKDGAVPLEQQLHKIIGKLEISAAREKEADRLREIRRLEREEEEKRKKELWQRKQEELKNFKELLSLVKRWHRSRIIREFVEARRAAISEAEPSAELVQWLEWSKQKADWYDPFINAPDELLADVKKRTLEFKSTSYW